MKCVSSMFAMGIALSLILTSPVFGKDQLTDEELDQVGAAGAVPLLHMPVGLTGISPAFVHDRFLHPVRKLGSFTPCQLCSRPTAISPRFDHARNKFLPRRLGINFTPCIRCAGP